MLQVTFRLQQSSLIQLCELHAPCGEILHPEDKTHGQAALLRVLTR
jgi:hypothetical protein